MSKNKNYARSAMSKPVVFDDALITSFTRYQDSDCVVRLLTKTHGRLTAYCKRGLLRRKGVSVVQAPALARIALILSEDKLARAVEIDIGPQMDSLSASLKGFAYASYLCELLEKFLPEEDPAPEIFAMVCDAFHSLCASGAKAILLRSFELKLLDYCGYLPEMPALDQDVESILAFDPIACRFLPKASERTFPFSSNAVKLAKSILIAKVGVINYEESRELLMIGRVFQSRLRLMGLTPLKSVTFLKQLQRCAS